MSPKRIRIELFGNIDYRKFHVTARMSSERQHGGFLGGNRYDPFRNFSFSGGERELTQDTKDAILRFYDIDGIESVGLDANTVELTRTPAYDWNDFEFQVVRAINAVAGWTDEDEVIVEYLLEGLTYDHEPLQEQHAYIARQRIEYARAERLFGDF